MGEVIGVDTVKIREVNSNIGASNSTIKYIDGSVVNICRGFSTEYLAVKLTVY